MKRVAVSPGEEAFWSHWQEYTSRYISFPIERDVTLEPSWTDGEQWHSKKMRVDFAFRQQQLVVEIDGFKWHSSYDAFVNDRMRDLALRSCGWDVIRFPSQMVTDSTPRCADIVIAELFKRSYVLHQLEMNHPL